VSLTGVGRVDDGLPAVTDTDTDANTDADSGCKSASEATITRPEARKA
jgi:hypothetical protein